MTLTTHPSANNGLVTDKNLFCLDVSSFEVEFYDTYYPELRSTYGVGFDPRNYDTTEPRYYFGRMRAYPQYITSMACQLTAPVDCILHASVPRAHLRQTGYALQIYHMPCEFINTPPCAGDRR
jgi:hypothetical protein